MNKNEAKKQAGKMVGEFNAQVRQFMFELTFKMILKVDPKVSLEFLDLMFDLKELPLRRDLIERARKIAEETDV